MQDVCSFLHRVRGGILEFSSRATTTVVRGPGPQSAPGNIRRRASNLVRRGDAVRSGVSRARSAANCAGGLAVVGICEKIPATRRTDMPENPGYRRDSLNCEVNLQDLGPGFSQKRGQPNCAANLAMNGPKKGI